MIIKEITKPNFLKSEFVKDSILSVDCGEQPLPIDSACLLGSINLTQYIKKDRSGFDLEKIGKNLHSIVRMMDNVNDLTKLPLDSQVKEVLGKRRIGLGIMGYGSSLLILKKRYGSKEALEMTEELMSFIANNVYQESSKLAQEKGRFSLFTEEYNNSNYLKALSKETRDVIKKYGLRNSHLLTIAPTGNSGVLSNCVSGGLEPVFLFDYIRTSSVTEAPEGLKVPEFIDWSNKSVMDNDGWEWIREGDENLLRKEHVRGWNLRRLSLSKINRLYFVKRFLLG